MFDRNTIIAFILIAIIFIGWQFLAVPQSPQQSPQERQVDTVTVTEQPAAQQNLPRSYADSASLGSFGSNPATTTAQLDTVKQAVDSIPDILIPVETDVYVGTLSSRGGGFVELSLKDYEYTEGGHVALLPAEATPTPTLISQISDFRDQSLGYRTDAITVNLSGNSSPQVVRFSAEVPGRGTIVKEYTFYPNRHDFDLRISINGAPQLGLGKEYTLVWLPQIPPSEPHNLESDYSSYKGTAYLGGEIYKVEDFDNDLLKEDITGSAQFVGSRSKYFGYAFIPQNTLSNGAYFRGESRKRTGPDGSYTEKRISAGIVIPTGSASSIDNSFKVFAGPLDYKLLKKYNVDLEDMIDWGWKIIKPFSMAVYYFCYWLHSIIPNYGIVIIITSILLKLITLPLTRKSLKSMAAMKELAPKMEELKAKYKSDPQKLNQEVMKMYKEHGANPMGGCLLMLPQMPLFFGLFQVFRSTIEFRQAYFVPPWTDLSQPDHTYILLVLTAALTYFQQKISMTDPKMKMMVYVMPIVFFFIMQSLPAGLVLYWFTFTSLSVLESVIFKRPGQVKNPQVK